MTPQQKENAEAVAGTASAWTAAAISHWLEGPLGSIGIHSWSDAASAGAAIYTVLLIGYFLWRRVLKPLFCRRRDRANFDESSS